MKRVARARDSLLATRTWRMASVYVNGKTLLLRDSKRHRERIERQAATRRPYSGSSGSRSGGAGPRAFED